MTRLRSVLAVSWAVLATPIVVGTFVGLSFLSHGLAAGTGIRISPWFTGGEVVRTIEHDGYRTLVRRPVFDGLLSERDRGFVQVEWAPLEGRSLPARLREEVDGDGAADFVIHLDTGANQATVDPLSPRVLGLQRVYDLGVEKAVRVELRRR
jgi:hypothetical protein